MSTPVIDTRGLAKTYPGDPDVHALLPTDLLVHPGDYLAVGGRSGSGKSTLLNLLGLLDTPTAGSYRLDGIDTHALDENERTALRGLRIGFVFQDFQLLPAHSAADNVALGLLYTGVHPRARADAAHDALARVGLTRRAEALPTTLSGGERQRVAIARALVGDPSLLLCDEPTGNLDSHNAARILDLIDELNDTGTTVVVITHDQTTAARAHDNLTIRDGLVQPRDADA